MGTGYTRNDTPNNIADGNVINASDLDGEFDAIQSAFNGSTGHSHDGTTGEGPQIATAGLADNAVTTAKITDANVTTAKIADSNVTTAKIADANVTLAKMAANSVDSDQYVDGSIDRVHLAADIVDGTKIADDSIDSEHYVDGSIDTAHIGNLQVTTAKIAADAIDGTKLADNAVDSEHYTDGSIDRVHLAADIVDGTKIADDSIDSEHYVDGSIDTAHIADDAVTSAKLDTNIQIAGTLGVTGVSSFADGSNSAPSLTFTSDTNTGIYRGGTDILKFVTAGTDAVTIDASQNVTFTGTATMDGLTVGDGSTTTVSNINTGNSYGLLMYKKAGVEEWRVGLNGADDFVFRNTDSKNFLNIADNGDISFYEDTGTTPKLFWDASAESLGIGTTSPNAPLNVNGTVELAGVLYRGIFGGTYQDSDIGAVTGGNPSAVQIQSPGSSRPATLLLGGSQGTNELLGTIGFYNSGNTDTKRLRSYIYGGQEGGTSNEQGGVLVFATASDTGTTPTQRMRIDSSGRVGIATSSPANTLHIIGTSATPSLRLGSISLTNYWDIGRENATTGDFIFSQSIAGSVSERMRIDSSGNVGIGTSSPSALLQVEGSDGVAGGAIMYTATGVASGYMSADAAGLCLATDTAGITFRTGITGADPTDTGSEAMRIDSSGNLLVGTTDTNPGNDSDASAGLSYNVGFGGQLIVRATANNPLMLNRTTSDGDIASFRKNGTDVGMIGTFGSALYFASPDGTDAGLRVGNSTVVPVTTTGALRDNAIDLGSVSARWKDLYLSGGVYLGGTGSANQLDDYEEGTWTPAVGGTATYSSNAGHYVKVGKFITAWFDIRVTSIGTGSTATISGLPFTAQTDSAVQGMGAAIGYFNSLATSVVNLHGRIDNSSAQIGLTGMTSAGTGSIQTSAIFGDGARVTGSLIYETV